MLYKDRNGGRSRKGPAFAAFLRSQRALKINFENIMKTTISPISWLARLFTTAVCAVVLAMGLLFVVPAVTHAQTTETTSSDSSLSISDMIALISNLMQQVEYLQSLINQGGGGGRLYPNGQYRVDAESAIVTPGMVNERVATIKIDDKSEVRYLNELRFTFVNENSPVDDFEESFSNISLWINGMRFYSVDTSDVEWETERSSDKLYDHAVLFDSSETGYGIKIPAGYEEHVLVTVTPRRSAELHDWTIGIADNGVSLWSPSRGNYSLGTFVDDSVTFSLLSDGGDDAGVVLELVSTSESLLINDDTVDHDDQGEFIIVFEVTAVDETARIASTPHMTGQSAKDGTFRFAISDMSGELSSAELDGVTSSLDSYGADRDGAYYIVSEGETETFKLTVIVEPSQSGVYRMGLASPFEYSTPGGYARTSEFSEADFKTDFLLVTGKTTAEDDDSSSGDTPTTTDPYPDEDDPVVDDDDDSGTDTNDDDGTVGDDESDTDANSNLSTHIQYRDGEQKGSTANVTRAWSVERCKRNIANNPLEFVRCTWKGEETGRSVVGQYIVYKNGSQSGSKNNKTKAWSKARCEELANNAPNQGFRCTWKGSEVFVNGKVRIRVDGELRRSQDGKSKAQARELCNTVKNNNLKKKVVCRWNGDVFDQQQATSSTYDGNTVRGASTTALQESIDRFVNATDRFEGKITWF